MSDAPVTIGSEYRDPSIFPCQVVGCDQRAAGWVIAALAGSLALNVSLESVHVFLCVTHLDALHFPHG